MSDLNFYISTAFLGLSKTNTMGFFQYISSRSITDLLIIYLRRNVYKPVLAYFYLNKSDGTFFKPIIVGGIDGATFINLNGAYWMLLHKKTETGLDKFNLYCYIHP